MTRFDLIKVYYPKGPSPSTQYLRTLAPKTPKSMVLGTRDLKYWVLGPSGMALLTRDCTRVEVATASTGGPGCFLILGRLGCLRRSRGCHTALPRDSYMVPS